MLLIQALGVQKSNWMGRRGEPSLVIELGHTQWINPVSKYGPWTSTINTTWELARNANSRTPPRPTQSKTWGEVTVICFNKAFRRFWRILKWENHFSKILEGCSKLPHFTHNSGFRLLMGGNCQSSALLEDSCLLISSLSVLKNWTCTEANKKCR